MDDPTTMVKEPAINHPYTMDTGPPNLSPLLYSVVTPVSTDMIENENAKFERTLFAILSNSFCTASFPLGWKKSPSTFVDK